MSEDSLKQQLEVLLRDIERLKAEVVEGGDEAFRLRSQLERAQAALQEIADADQELDPSGRSDADCMRDLARRTLAALREFDAAGDRTGERDGYTPEMFREARRRHAEEQAGAWSEDGGKDE